MFENEPRPGLVIRNQLLAFALLTLLGSCVHLPGKESPARLSTAPSPAITVVTAKQAVVSPANSKRWYSAR